MTFDLMKDLLLEYGVLNGSRFTKKEKEKFRDSMLNFCKINDIQSKVLTHNNSVNMELGNVLAAKIILVVAYDTPIKFLLKNKDHYPLNQGKILKRNRTDIIIRSILDISGLLIVTLLYLAFQKYLGLARIAFAAGILISILATLRLRKITGTKINMNCNSASIALALSMLKEENGECAVILIDNYYKDFSWFAYYDKLPLKQKNICLLLESLASGETLVLSGNFNKKIKNFKSLDVEYIKESSMKIKTMHLGHLKKGELIIDNCHVDEDYIIDVKKLNILKEFIIKLKGEF